MIARTRMLTAALSLALLATIVGCSATPPGGGDDGGEAAPTGEAATTADRCEAAYLEIYESAGVEVEVISVDKFPLDGLSQDLVAESCLLDVVTGGVEAYMGLFVGAIGTESALRTAIVANGYAPEEGVPDRYIRGTDPQVIVAPVLDTDPSDPIGAIYGQYVIVTVELGVVG